MVKETYTGPGALQAQKGEGAAWAQLAAMPEVKRRICHGIALWLGGWSIRSAAKEAGCSSSALHRNLHKIEPSPFDLRANVAEAALPLALAINEESGRQLAEALDQGEIKPSQLPVVWGISADKLVAIQKTRQEKAPADGLEALLAKLGDGEALELRVHRQPPAVDVTPKGEP